ARWAASSTLFVSAPATYPGVLRARIRRCRVSHCAPTLSRKGEGVRAFGLDVHRDFCEVAIAEGGAIRSAGRVATRVGSLELFAQSLVAGDVVALEATSGADRIVSLLQANGIRVIVANSRKLRSITEAKAKTDRLDARTLARLLVSGLLDEVWTPDERTRSLRRLTNRRERLVRARTRAKNEAHGCWRAISASGRRSRTPSGRRAG